MHWPRITEIFCFMLCLLSNVDVISGSDRNNAVQIPIYPIYPVRHRRSTVYELQSKTVYIPEGKTSQISCPPSSHIIVKNASFYYQSSGCDATGPLQRKCNYRRYCSVESSTKLCGNPRNYERETLSVLFSCMTACRKTIMYCTQHRCNSAIDVWCIECIDKVLYKLGDNGRKCLHQCTWENRWCWPGHCSENNYARDCQCETNFKRVYNSNMAKCQPTQTPELLTCRMSVLAVNNEMKQSVANGSTTCYNQQHVYGNIQISQVITNISTDFSLNATSVKPSFVGDHAFGVTDVYIDLVKMDTFGNEIFSIRKISKEDNASTNPVTIFHDDAVLNNKPGDGILSNGQSLCLRFQVKGGGYIVSDNIKTHQKTNVPFDKTVTTRLLCYYFDDAKPVCCKEAGTCHDDPLGVNSRTTTHRTVTINISQWIDPIPSGGNSVQTSKIESYIVTVYEMREEGPTHLNRDPSPIVAAQEVNKTVNIQLPGKSPALYEISLEVKDVAENVRHVRRFVLHDNSSKIDVIPYRQVNVVSASKKTKYMWQTNLNDICVSWVGRYHNSEYQAVNLLKPIKHDGLYSGLYEQQSGILPVTGTTNVDGITDFTFSLYRNGKTVIFRHNVENITSQSVCLNPSKSDGDTFLFNLEVFDIMNHTYAENITVFLDSTVPDVKEIGIEKDGIRQLFAHNSTDLSKMVLSFDAYDRHSGILEIMWLLQAADDSEVIGVGSVGVKALPRNKTCSPNTHCYCPSVGVCEMYRHYLQMHSLVVNDTHMGNHNRGYIISLKVTNNALLSVIEHVDILLDNSPPEIGVVLEGPDDGPDIDYTSQSEIEVHWSGFIDHESGIKFYRVMLSTACIKVNTFNSKLFFQSNTTGTNIIIPLQSGIKQYVTVIAYNNAMEASLPVCSDGIEYDNSPPKLSNVSIDNAEVGESIACFAKKSWKIDKYGRKLRLSQVPLCDQRCVNRSNNEILKILPEAIMKGNDSHHISEFLCLKLPYYNVSLFYIPSDRMKIRWSIEDSNSQIDNVKIGFGRSTESKENPDIFEYEKSHNRQDFLKYHTGLGDGTMFYVFIRAENKAGLSIIATFGPILIDETPPHCPDNLPVITSDGKVMLYWTNESFSDDEQDEEIGSLLIQIENENGAKTPYYEWDIDKSIKCPLEGKRCILFPVHHVQNLDTESGLQFHFNIHAYNYANHFCMTRSVYFKIPSKYPPGHGYVLDVDPSNSDSNQSEDIDVMFSKNKFCVRYGGFYHHENITFMIGLGSKIEHADVIPFQTVVAKNMSSELYCQDGLSLKTEMFYYTTVIAKCSGGNISLSSDGFLILDKMEILTSLKVYDGSGLSEENKIDHVILDKNISLSEMFDVHVHEPLHIGKTFTIKIFPENSNITISGNYSKTSAKSISFISTSDSTTLSLLNIGEQTYVERIEVYEGSEDRDFQTSTTSVSAHWTLNTLYAQYVSYFKVGVYNVCDTNKTCPVGNTLITHLYKCTIATEPLKDGKYYVTVQPCFGNQCLSPVLSNGLYLRNRYPSEGIVTSTLYKLRDDCYSFQISWDPFECPGEQYGNKLLFYKYGIYNDRKGSHRLDSYHRNETTTITTVHQCLVVPVYPHRPLYTCVQGYCTSGNSNKICIQTDITVDPNLHLKNTVYDVSFKNPAIKNVLPAIHSQLIGSKLYILHENEIDFSRSSVSVGGVLLGHVEATRWFLMTERKIPERNCDDDLSCTASLVTETGYADFGTNVLKREGVYYVCAQINGSSLDNNSSQISSQHERNSWCSNGFIVDDTPPVQGFVKIKANEAGYIDNGSEMYISWNGFTDNNMGHVIGYNIDLMYQYAIGTYPFGEDIQMFTQTTHSTSAIVRNLSLQSGQQYYATVKAQDAVGLETKSTSYAVMLDNTPPSSGMIRVGDIHRSKYIFSNNTLVIHWMGFSDSESGIQKVELGIGTHPYLDDVVAYSLQEKEFAEIAGKHFQDGHMYYATLKVQNRAGLFVIVVSDFFIIDSSPPSLGVVMDGVTSELRPFDVDFQRNTSSIMVYWTGFTDHHSGISHYKVGLGTELGLANVREMTYVGLQTFWVWHSDFIPGTKYYVLVEACNRALLCRRVTSNGIIVDNSPPVPGLVFVGGAIHSKYIPHRTHLYIEWVGFEDPESEIDHFEVCVSSFNGSCDVINFMNVLLASSVIPKRITLPIGYPLHVIVRAYNRVGLYVDRISDTFIVDLTPPTLIQDIQFLQIVNGNLTTVSSQWDPSYISVSWSFDDEESPIIEQILWITTHRGGHTAVESIDVRNSNNTTIIMKNNLRSGDTYSATITACNSAGLCSSSFKQALLLDSTPPTIGGFKPEMSWNNTAQNLSEITLTWYGFNDAESGISTYYITIGQTYSGSELSDGIIRVEASENATEERHIFLINHTISTQQKVVLSIWAENHVNLNSTIAKVTVLAVPEVVTGEYGVLLLERHSCDVDYCTKDCTCAIVGQKCVDVHVNHSCKLVNENNTDLIINIPSAYRIGNSFISISSACMEATWFALFKLPSRYEWTIGIDGMEPGNGIFDSGYEKVWYDVGTQTNLKFCLPRKKSFLHDEHYVVYIRIWLSRTEYFIKKSDPILIDLTPPVVRRGQAVIDTSESSCKVDRKFSNSTNSLTSCWNKTFSDQQSDISHYYVSVGTVVEGDDIVEITDIGKQTSITWSDLLLHPGVKYYVTVTAVNTVGLSTRLSSDGILIDNERPIAGVVYNTQRHTSIYSQSDSVSFGVSWHGFDDQHSYIKDYHVAIVRCNERRNIEPLYQSVSLRNNINITGIQLIHGDHYCALVKAVDAAGYESFVSSSPPLLIDTTPPTGYTCEGFTSYFNTSLHLQDGTLKTTSYNMTFVPNTFYKFDIHLLNVDFESRIELQIEDFVTLLPITVDVIGIKSSYLYLSSSDRQIVVSLTFHGFPADTNGSLEVSRCNKYSTSQDLEQMIIMNQISPTEVAVCMRFVDLENKLRNIMLGYGTHHDGFQVKPLMPSGLLYHSIIETDVSHGSPLYVSILVENNAGLKYTFQPSAIVIDHTPPEINDVKVTPRYETTTNVTLVYLDYHWVINDNESTVRQCQIKIGTIRGAENIFRWTNVPHNGTYQSPSLDVQHGDELYTTIRCINSINLIQAVNVGPLSVSYLPPTPPDNDILILPQNINSQYNNRQYSIQSNESSVMFFWNNFEDISSTVNYQCRLRHDDRVLLAWRDVFERNVCCFDDVTLKDNDEYVVEVRGQNLNHHGTGNLNSTLVIDSSRPVLTGKKVRVLTKNNDVCRITWEECFVLDSSLYPRFKVTVGRKEGHADIVKEINTLKDAMDINCKNANEIYVKVTALYITGESSSMLQGILT